MTGEKSSGDRLADLPVELGEKAMMELKALEETRKNAKPGTTPQFELDISTDNLQVESLILQAQKESRETGVDPVKILWAKAQGLPKENLSTNEANVYRWYELAIETLSKKKK